MVTTIVFGVAGFITIILALVLVLMFAKSRLVASGDVTVTSTRAIQLEITGVAGGTPHGGQLIRLVELEPGNPLAVETLERLQ